MSNITLKMMRQSLYAAVVADALDGLGYCHQSPRVTLTPYTSPRVLVGRCKTTLWADMYHNDPNPYELELKAVDECSEDSVLICAAGGSMHAALWGELLSTASQNSGCVGAIVDGATRDVTKIRDMNFPVFARGTSVYDSLNRQRVIETDVPVEIAGVKFCSGDLVIADIDGVVVVPQEIEGKAIQIAWDKVHTENKIRDEIRDGMKAVAAYEKYGVL
ncbi:MAG: RraA family protein [Fuerstiella sp.]|nr:RraA family protein [Fuerstiella sp.]